mmetsp:Transcript_24112/g.67045  ORF Transcript_24112/g.67045 Transcript_24112/m.67045 type:complete len:1556 (+) Transcript_24112:2-4669(+)
MGWAGHPSATVAAAAAAAGMSVPAGNYSAIHQAEWEKDIYWGSDDGEEEGGEGGGDGEDSMVDVGVFMPEEDDDEEGKQRGSANSRPEGPRAATNLDWEDVTAPAARPASQLLLFSLLSLEDPGEGWRLARPAAESGGSSPRLLAAPYMMRLERHDAPPPQLPADGEEGGEAAAADGAGAEPTEDAGEAGAKAGKGSTKAAVKDPPSFLIQKLPELNLEKQLDPDLVASNWMDMISWRGYVNARSKPKFGSLVLDLNDPDMVFMETPVATSMPPATAAHLSNSAAWVAPPIPKAKVVVATAPGPGKFAKQLARSNISQDADYNLDGKEKGEQGGATNKPGAKHSIHALNMRTSALNLSNEELLSLHHPVANMLTVPGYKPPQVSVNFPRGATITATITLRSLAGLVAVKKNVPVKELAVKAAWEEWSKKLHLLVPVEPPLLRLNMPTGTALAMKENNTLFQAGIKSHSTIWATFTKVMALETAKISVLPQNNDPVRPPGAFTKMKEMSGATEGHLIVLEYLEELPLLLSNPGMGAQITTFYRKTSTIDTNWKHLQDKVEVGPDGAPAEKETWMVGKVVPLNPDDDTPFLGDVLAGTSQAAVETNLFKAPACPHPPQRTDFLLIRLPCGALVLREFTGSLTVAQQLPNVKVPIPGGATERDYEDKRLQDFVFRDLRRKEKKLKGATVPTITVAEVVTAFPRLSDTIIRTRLKEKCLCAPVKAYEVEGVFCLREGARLPDEKVMRGTMTPDLVCAYESMRAAVARLARLGITRPNLLRGTDVSKIKMAVECMPQEPEVMKAARVILEELQATPWHLTSNFVEAVREGRGQLALVGTGDPSGRGVGFSFLKEVRKQSNPAEQQLSRRDTGNITGTSSDLRRLKMGEAEKILMNLGVTKQEIAGRSRWELIGLVRDLSSAAAQDGGTIGARLTKFARSSRVSTAQAVQQYMERAQEIFEKQAAAIREVPPAKGPAETDSESDAEGFEELEDLLEQEDDEADDPKPSKEPTEEDDRAALQAMREEGFLKPADAKDGGGRLGRQPVTGRPVDRPIPGARRLRRTITVTYKNGTVDTREVIYTDLQKADWLRPLAAASRREAVNKKGVPITRIPVVQRAETARKKAEKAKVQAEKAAKAARTKARTEANKAAAAAAKASAVRCTACGGFGHTQESEACPKHHSQAPPPQTSAPPVKLKLPKAEKMKKHQHAGPAAAVDESSVTTPVTKVVLKTSLPNMAPVSTPPSKKKKHKRKHSEPEEDPLPFLTLSPYSGDPFATITTPPSTGRPASAPAMPTPSSGGSVKPAKKKARTGGNKGTPPQLPFVLAPSPPSALAAPPLPLPLPAQPAALEPMPLAAEGASPAQVAAFNTILQSIIADFTQDPTYFPFKANVTRRYVPDYQDIVKNPMSLEKINRRFKQRPYVTVEDFLADAALIAENAQLYNNPASGSKIPTPGLIPLAQELVAAIKARVEDRRQEIDGALRPPLILPESNLWLCCDLCQKWRLVLPHVYKKYSKKGSYFTCSMDNGRPLAYRNCETEDDEVIQQREAAMIEEMMLQYGGV